MKINKHHGVYNKSNRGNTKIKYFVVHYTGTMAPAENNCKFFAGGNRDSSADYFIDRDGTIWEYNDPTQGQFTWHCGDGNGVNGITNANSIGIEVVSDGVRFTQEQINSLNWLYGMLSDKFGPLEVVRHYDASGKACPAPYVDEQKWKELKDKIMNQNEWIKDDKGWWYRHANGTYTTNDWEFINNYWYYFDKNGYAMTGWQKINGQWFYLTPKKIDGFPECSMVTGWLKDKDKWYYLAKNGAMVSSQVVEIKNKWYAFGADGAMHEEEIKTDKNGALIL